MVAAKICPLCGNPSFERLYNDIYECIECGWRLDIDDLGDLGEFEDWEELW